jgi:hypothetical protein
MAGRPRLYANAAEKTRAYRQRRDLRVALVDRVCYEQLEVSLKRLMLAVDHARQAKDPLAMQVDTVTWVDALEDLAEHFEGRVGPDSSPLENRTRQHAT